MQLVVHKSWAGFGEAAPSTDSEETIDAFQELGRTPDRCALPHRARSSWIQPSTRSTAKSTRCRMMMPDRSTPGGFVLVVMSRQRGSAERMRCTLEGTAAPCA